MAETETLPIRFEMRASERWMEAVEVWRAQQKPIPSRAEAIRRLVEKSLSS